MAHGGKRAGAGRKQGFPAIKAEEARRVFAERVAAEIEPIADALIAKAKKGDVRAAMELFNRAWGRPLQTVELEQNIIEEPRVELTPAQHARFVREEAIRLGLLSVNVEGVANA